MKDLLWIAPILIVLTSAQSTLQYHPQPPITQNNLFVINYSPVDGRPIASSHLDQFLSLSHNSSNVTLFTLTQYDRAANGSKIDYTFSYAGSWYHVESSPVTLSCNLIIEPSSGMMGLVLYNKTTGFFNLVGSLPLSTFTTDPNVTIATIQAVMHVGENC